MATAQQQQRTAAAVRRRRRQPMPCSARHTRAPTAPAQVSWPPGFSAAACARQAALPACPASCARLLSDPCSLPLVRRLAVAVGGLEPHTAYAFRVRAFNAVGSSLSEAETFRTAPAAPSCPLAVTLRRATATSLQLSWQPPRADHGAPVAAYQLECARGTRTSSGPASAWRVAHQGPGLAVQVGREGGRQGGCDAVGAGVELQLSRLASPEPRSLQAALTRTALPCPPRHRPPLAGWPGGRQPAPCARARLQHVRLGRLV